MTEADFKFRKKLGQLLLEKGLVSEEQLHLAMEKQASSRKFLGEVLIEQNLVTEEQILKLLAEQEQMPFLDLKKEKLQINRELISKIPPQIIKRFKILPFQYKDNALQVLICSTAKAALIPDMEKILCCRVKMCVTIKKYFDLVSANVFENIRYSFNPSDQECLSFKKLDTMGIAVPENAAARKKKIGEMLIERGLITEDQLLLALDAQKSQYRELEDILIEGHTVTDEDILEVKALLNHSVYVSLLNFTPAIETLKLFTLEEMKSVPFVPLSIKDNTVNLAVPDLENLDFFKKFEAKFSFRMEFMLAQEGQIINTLSRINTAELDAAVAKNRAEDIRISRIKEKKLGRMLVKMGYISQDKLQSAWEKSSDTLLSEYLIKNGLVPQQIILKLKEVSPPSEYIELRDFEPDMKVVEKVPPDALMKCLAFPVKIEGSELLIAVAEDDPDTLKELDVIRLATTLTIRYMVADKNQVKRLLSTVYSDFSEKNEPSPIPHAAEVPQQSIQQQIQDKPVILNPPPSISVDEFSGKCLQISAEDIERLDQISSGMKKEKRVPLDAREKATLESLAGDSTIIPFMDQILLLGVNKGASDIHIEPFERKLLIRFRINGILHILSEYAANLATPLAARIMVLSGLDISEKRVSQDGSFKHTLSGNEVEFRVLACPSAFGESVVLRIMNLKGVQHDLNLLGFTSSDLYLIKKNLQRSYGMILVAGPTGSGKTTSLYSMLNYLNNSSRKILTIEDPVENHFPGIIQLQVAINKSEPEKSFDFGDGLKASMRSDPDIIMLGEIRDNNVAGVAVQAALTGHLVLATLHANNSIEAVNRMVNLGVEKELLISCLKLVIAQRLVRSLCPDCTDVVENPEEILRLGGVPEKEYTGKVFHYSRTCPSCHFTGSTKRSGIYEVLEISDGLRNLFLSGASCVDLRNFALSEGLVTLKKSAFLKTCQGEIALEEFIKTSLDTV